MEDALIKLYHCLKKWSLCARILVLKELKMETTVQTNSKPKKIQHSLCALDFTTVQFKVKDSPKKKNTSKKLSDSASTKMMTRQKKLMPKTGCAVRPPVLSGTPDHKNPNRLINQNSSPPFAKKINTKLDSVVDVCTGLQKKILHI